MSNYYTLRTEPIFDKPLSKPDLGSSSNSFGNLFLNDKIYINNIELDLTTTQAPTISSITYAPGRSTANIAGNETLTVNGSRFDVGAVVLVDNIPVDITGFVSNSQLTFVTPIKSAGVYSLFVVNSTGATGASATGITYAA